MALNRTGAMVPTIFAQWKLGPGFGGRISLDRLASTLGIKGKGGMSGADVWPAYQQGKHKEIAEYCEDDVRITHDIYKRLNFQGVK